MFLATSWPLPRSQKAKASQRRGHRRALESLGMSLQAEKTQAAWLGSGEPASSRLALPGRGHELPVAGEIDFLGNHFLGPERFRARETYGQPPAPQDPHGDRGGLRQATGEAAVFPGVSPNH